MEIDYSLREGDPGWSVCYPDDWRDREKKIYSDPHGADISSLPSTEYKYFDRFREISVEHQSGMISKEEFQGKLRRIRRDYEIDMSVYVNALFANYEHQENIKKSGEIITKLTKGEYADMYEAFMLALQCISAMREENLTEKSIISKAKEKMIIC